MRKWIAGKLFDLAVWLDWDTASDRSISVAVVELGVRKAMAESKKVGRPKGRKDGVGPKPEPKRRGRPPGSKNKPKVAM
jgi:hypothetical protein